MNWNLFWRTTLIFSLAVFVLGSSSSAQENPKIFKLGYMSSFSGQVAAIAQTQKKGVMLAVDQINEKGGLKMPWGNVKVEVLVKDDEAKLDVGVRRFRELVAEGMNGLTGTLWNPMAAAINEECKVTPMPYFPGSVPALDSFIKGTMADCTFACVFTPWSFGYVSGVAMTKTLGAKKIYHLSRSDIWGTTMRKGLAEALKDHGGEVVGMSESPQGTLQFTSMLNKAKMLNPDVLFDDFFATDAIASIKQAHEIGLQKQAKIFNPWITNVVASALSQNQLAGLYAMQYVYHDLGDNFEDKEVAKRVKAVSEAHMKKYGEPPDNLGWAGYIATEVLFQIVQKAGSFDPKKISKVALEAKDLATVQGPIYFRKDHQAVQKYAMLLLQGKSPEERKGKWDFFKVIGHFGGESVLPPLKILGF